MKFTVMKLYHIIYLTSVPLSLLFTVYITQLEHHIGMQDDIIMEQQFQFQQQQEELNQQQQHINNLEEVEVSLKARNTRILGKFYEYKFSINALVSILISLACLKIIIARKVKFLERTW